MLHLIKYPHFRSLQVKLLDAAIANDAACFMNLINNINRPEYKGYNTIWCRQSGMLPLRKTDVTFLPLIENPPADPNTKY